MERDFLGLSSKREIGKEDNSDGGKDSALVKGSGMHWSFSNKVSVLPQFLSFKASQEEKPRKTVYDPLASSGFVPVSTADAFAGSVQRNLILDNKQVGSHHAMAAYPLQQFDLSVQHPHELRVFPVSSQSNQTMSVAMSTPLLQNHTASAGQIVVGSTSSAQPLGGIPIITPVSIFPATSSIVGNTDLRNAPRPSGPAAQLTIFYAGSVNVYNNVSPEKAQAIMLLAGNGPPLTPNSVFPIAQVPSPVPRPSTADCFIGNQPHTSPFGSGLPSPMSVTSRAGPQSGAGAASANDTEAVKPIGALASPVNQPEPLKVVSSLGSATATLLPSAVPQARKASLARFLEKRKERVMSTSPYSVRKKSPECSSTPGSDVGCLPMNSPCSSPLPAAN